MKNHQHPWTSRQETLRLILERSRFQPRVETIPVREALGRITAREVLAVINLPNCPASMMDGIAIKSANLDGGIPRTDHWREGIDYVFSSTGVGIPDDYDTVVVIEKVEFDEDGKLQILSAPVPGQNINQVGEMILAGEILVPAHFHLGPAQLALLTSGGVDEVAVLAKPRVAILPTGNELVPAGCKPPRGKNVESNGTMVEAGVKMLGGEPRPYPITLDNPDDLRSVINDALEWADIVVLIGGSSKGNDDRAIEVLETIGEVLVYEGDYGPGKHTTMTIAGTTPIVGAVGPTIGAEYAVEWYIAPLINKYLSQPTVEPRRLPVQLLEDIHTPMPFDFYLRMNVQKLAGSYAAKLASAHTASLARLLLANAILRVPGDVPGYKAGETVEVELRCPLEMI